MVFNSLSYIVFLWTVFVLFWARRDHLALRYAFLLVVSYWFYGQDHWAWAGLLAATTLVDFVAAAAIHRAHARGEARVARAWLLASVVLNLGVLGAFKYFDFFSGNVEAALGGLGLDVHTWRLDLVLPVGISFYTFQSLSYTIDVYQRRLEPVRSLTEFALYVSFFPQLVAGPIVRAVDFLPQMRAPRPPHRVRVAEGVYLVLQGLAKKLVLGDLIGTHLVDPAFADPVGLDAAGAAGVLVLGLGFIIQVYGDFGGYTDIALGSARLLGFHLRPNFARPLAATTLDAFWKRWHISMTTWFRDYVFVPLGGSRRGPLRTGFNLMLTLVAVGLWHGATWNYVLFGVLHALALIAVHLFRARTSFRGGAAWIGLCWAVNLAFLSLTILLYRSPDLHVWGRLVRQMGDWTHFGLSLPWQVGGLCAAALLIDLLPAKRSNRVLHAYVHAPAAVRAAIIVVVALVLFGLRPPGILPFYYFQF